MATVLAKVGVEFQTKDKRMKQLPRKEFEFVLHGYVIPGEIKLSDEVEKKNYELLAKDFWPAVETYLTEQGIIDKKFYKANCTILIDDYIGLSEIHQH